MRWFVVLGWMLCACGRVDFATLGDGGGDHGPTTDARVLDGPAIPIRFIQTQSAATTNTNVLTTAFATDVTAGSTIIVGLDFDHGGAEPGVAITDSAGRVYQAIVGPAPTGGNTQSQYLFSAYASTPGPTTITANLTQSSNLVFELRALEYAGIALASPVDVTSASNGMAAGAGEVDATPIVTTGTNEVILAMEVCD